MTDILDNVLSPETRTEKTDLDVLKELFQSKDVETKTQLTDKQIILINQKRIISKLLGWDSLNLALSDFMLLQISNSRRGRSEFVESFKGEREKSLQQNKGMFGNLMDKIRI